MEITKLEDITITTLTSGLQFIIDNVTINELNPTCTIIKIDNQSYILSGN